MVGSMRTLSDGQTDGQTDWRCWFHKDSASPKKTGSCFRLKDKVSIEHQSGLVYAFKKGKYVGETKVRFGDRIDQHCHTDKKSAVYKFKVENQVQVSKDDFEILDMGYSNTLNRKLAEALFIKDIKPELNEQVKSYKLNLFNWFLTILRKNTNTYVVLIFDVRYFFVRVSLYTLVTKCRTTVDRWRDHGSSLLLKYCQ